MSDHDDQLVADYLRRLTAAASALPADRRAELIEEITAHIAEARAAGGAAPGGSPSVPDILERLGDPGQIVQAAAEPSFGELAAGPPEPPPPASSASVRNAVRLMYLGAAVSLIKVIVDLATEGATRAAILRGFKQAGVTAPVSQLNSGATNTLVLAFVLGLIGVGLWILVARASSRSKDWARVTGSVLFGLDTLALLIGPPDVGIRGPETTVTRVFAGVVWLIGLAAVVFLWQRDSTVFFRAARAPRGGGREESGHPANQP